MQKGIQIESQEFNIMIIENRKLKILVLLEIENTSF